MKFDYGFVVFLGVVMVSYKDEDELLVCGRVGRRFSEFLRFFYKKLVKSKFKIG